MLASSTRLLKPVAAMHAPCNSTSNQLQSCQEIAAHIRWKRNLANQFLHGFVVLAHGSLEPSVLLSLFACLLAGERGHS